MRLAIGTRRLVSWLACLAILGSSFAPILAQAAQSRADGWLGQVCSASGSRSAPGSADHAGLGHCLFCVMDASQAVLPPVHPAWQARLPLVFQLRSSSHAGNTLPDPAWGLAQPRAPPFQA